MNNTEPAGKKLSKKELRQLLYDKLATALAEFKPKIKDKKFESNLQKTSKLFADDVVKAAARIKDKTKKTGKKKIKKTKDEKVTE